MPLPNVRELFLPSLFVLGHEADNPTHVPQLGVLHSQRSSIETFSSVSSGSVYFGTFIYRRNPLITRRCCMPDDDYLYLETPLVKDCDPDDSCSLVGVVSRPEAD